MTQDELLAALADVRLPVTMRALDWHEMSALLGLGLLIAALIALILAPLLRQRASARRRILATRGLPVQDRLLAVARITGHLPPALREAAYLPAPQLRDEQIERAAKAGR
ncbi:hypothetical protein [Paracoccus tegillarcae]|uniref:Uncharacterized protein n=1 Tax=Paracoccus tegillarcae TaxID=1529068 RepID=A0A2K9F781_9RHOB|nr:hypothetical protein [Paracoccus tegillarcae]AUH35051.1 hypothetical protein CUV01_18205 [Paracoccus tegillarcae]